MQDLLLLKGLNYVITIITLINVLVNLLLFYTVLSPAVARLESLAARLQPAAALGTGFIMYMPSQISLLITESLTIL